MKGGAIASLPLLLAGLGIALQSCVPSVPPRAADDVRARSAAASGTSSGVVSDGRYVMGTVLEIELRSSAPRRAEAQRALDGAFAEASALDGLLSRFLPASDVSRLNAHAGGAPIEVDPRVREALVTAQRGASATDGAFDVTVGPIVEAWIHAAMRGRPPDRAERERALARVGAERIRIDADGRVGLAAGTALDLGGLAKGFALDRMAADLRRAGLTSGLLSFGQSSVQALGAPPGASAWRLLLRAPEEGYLGTLDLRDLALSVSASLSQSSEIGGIRYGHVVDPRTGHALTEVREAAVVSPSATVAEILSTALLVLDEPRGRAAVAALGAEALVVDAGRRGWQTPGWARVTGFAALRPPAARAGSAR